MHMQIMIYPVMGSWQITATKHAATDVGYGWTQLISDLVTLPDYLTDDPWDVLWYACQHLAEECIRHTGQMPPTRG